MFRYIFGGIAVLIFLMTGIAFGFLGDFVGWLWTDITTGGGGGGIRHGDYRWDDPEIGYKDNPFRRN